MKSRVYGYVRVSTVKQKIERQIENIKNKYPEAVIIAESYTGTKMDRPAWNKLYKQLKKGDTIIFDEVSRMSRNAEEGFETYKTLFEMGVNLIFIKEPHINTSVYRDKLQQQADKISSNTGSKATDKLLNSIMSALHEYTIDLAKEQIELAFKTAQAEVDFIHIRTSEGVRRAQANGKQIGIQKGQKLTTKKSIAMKTRIKELSKDFEGTNTDSEVMKITGLARNTYYKYKRELKEGV
jgi:DNA invertase Pin-like site-specific DNA recombinase